MGKNNECAVHDVSGSMRGALSHPDNDLAWYPPRMLRALFARAQGEKRLARCHDRHERRHSKMRGYMRSTWAHDTSPLIMC